MEHLNYSRQIAKQCMAMLAKPSIDPETRKIVSDVAHFHKVSTKFVLPNGGRLYEDKELRALDESMPLRLPYPYLCLEYPSIGQDRPPDKPIGFVNGVPEYEQENSLVAPKRVVYAREQSSHIVVTIAFWARDRNVWCIMPECAIPETGYLDRGVTFSGRPSIKAAFKTQQLPISDYMDEIGALLCFLNVLQCSNVHVTRSEPKKAGKNIKAALPFDTYHVLTIDVPGKNGNGAATGGHRSPREHLRRGHIRRLADSRRIWVNAAVVAAGRGAGVVKKDYALRYAA